MCDTSIQVFHYQWSNITLFNAKHGDGIQCVIQAYKYFTNSNQCVIQAYKYFTNSEAISHFSMRNMVMEYNVWYKHTSISLTVIKAMIKNNSFEKIISTNLHCLDRSTHMIENAYIHCLDLTSVWRQRRRRRPACAVEWQWRWRKRLVCTRSRAVTEEASVHSR
jgi:hypothetical protein